MEHINKKLKANIIVSNEGNNNNNNIYKIIVLPIIIQKYILEILYKSLEYKDNNYRKFGYQKCQGRAFNLQIKDQLYALVNWVWFKKCQYEVSYGFLYEIIKDLQFKSFYFHSDSNSDSGATHPQQYHSISKLNQNVKSVIINDYIPLYALYRFLKAPKLRTLEFSLQFHFLSSIYRKNKENINGNSMINFNELDNFQFNDSKGKYKSDGDMKYYIENGINEDNQLYCSYSRQYYSIDTIPPYSKFLLDECFKLLKNNTTIIHLKITSEQCDGCDRDADEDDGDQYSLFDDQFFNDLFDSLSANKTIKELYLEFGYLMEYWETNLLEPKISMMLDQNKTLEYLYLGRSLDVAQVSKLTTNTKCKLISK